MKATGIVRRIDELGRLVIPMEIRRTMKIRQGDPLEIFTDKEGELNLRKYSPMQSVEDYAASVVEAIAETLEGGAIICDKDTVIAASGMPKKEFQNVTISSELEHFISQRKSAINNTPNSLIPIHSGDGLDYVSQVIVPIVAAGDVYGAIVVTSNKQQDETALKVATASALYLAKQLA